MHLLQQRRGSAREAFDQLELRVGDYGQYLVDAAFDKQGPSLRQTALGITAAT